ncbi:hypothetical protein [Actinomadura rayongensis]|uniref:DUF3592 domain-containing protein n=1 Tax=Actinomadura rayongensis TaxID=1429076 RepID=A0A6I4W6Q1_9ACTN|nr:hypothetical protein [Actinomadura rayongensis]MXQ65238.1 hypothetical protein [Actinomadura rayongensis]
MGVAASMIRAGASTGAAAVAIGGYVAMGWLDFYGPGGFSWLGVVVALAATALGLCVAFAVSGHMATPVLLLLALPFCGFFIHNAAEDRVLGVRGVSGACRVDDVRKTSATVLNGAPEGGNSTITGHVHRLRCPSGGPTELNIEKAARTGSTLRLTWDPDDRVDPRPAADVPHGTELILPSLAVVAVLLLAVTAGFGHDPSS